MTADDLTPLFIPPQILTDDEGIHRDVSGREHVAVVVGGETTFIPGERAVLEHLESLGVIEGMVAGPERIGMVVRTRRALRDHPEVWERVWAVTEDDEGYQVATYNCGRLRVAPADLRISEAEEPK